MTEAAERAGLLAETLRLETAQLAAEATDVEAQIRGQRDELDGIEAATRAADAEVARLYDELFLSLELRERHDAMLHKLGSTQEAVETVIDLWHGRRSRSLEWTIVLLIVFEIGMTIFRAH